MLTIGKTATVSTTVADNNTAKAVGSGNLNVFATPMMIALMEQAACECLANSLEFGQSSVGTQVNVVHTAASQIGAKITATAVIKNIDGRKITFVITARDEAKEIGSGTHERFLIDVDRFMSRV